MLELKLLLGNCGKNDGGGGGEGGITISLFPYHLSFIRGAQMVFFCTMLQFRFSFLTRQCVCHLEEDGESPVCVGQLAALQVAAAVAEQQRDELLVHGKLGWRAEKTRRWSSDNFPHFASNKFPKPMLRQVERH